MSRKLTTPNEVYATEDSPTRRWVDGAGRLMKKDYLWYWYDEGNGTWEKALGLDFPVTEITNEENTK